MMRHEESPEKLQYNMAATLFLDTPFSCKNFQTHSFPSILKKSNPPFMKGGGVDSNYVYKPFPQITSGNLRGTETLVTVKFRGLTINVHHLKTF